MTHSGSKDEIQPTMDHFSDPYVLQLIEALAKQQDQIEDLKREKADVIRLTEVVKSKERQIDDLVARATILQQDTQKYKKARYDTLEQHEKLSEEWKASREVLVREKGDMQLVAGRYQYQFEHAMKCINAIDDFFEYPYKVHEKEGMKAFVRLQLAKFTDAVKPKGK